MQNQKNNSPQFIGTTKILDTFAEAFGMKYTRVIITAADAYWLAAATNAAAGYACSVIGCDAEAAVETWLSPQETPDDRVGAAILFFAFSTDKLAKAVTNRVGQCAMTCPTTAVFNGLREAETQVPLGKHLRYFGDGFQKSKVVAGNRFWRIPVMDGEFLVEEAVGVGKGVAGGNIILQGETTEHALAAARRASEAIERTAGVIAPFPGGVVRSGSKVGSRYKALVASTNDAHCPTLRGRVDSELVESCNAAYELVIDGVDEASVGEATLAAMHAAAGEGIPAIGAGNYGGKLGKFHFHLHSLLDSTK